MTTPHAPLAEALHGRYTLERELGRGGMGIVWLALDVKHNRRVAIKVVRPELAASLGAERFLREVRIAAHLQHPHILTLIDSGELPSSDGHAPGALYYVMPYVDGETLRARLARERRFSAGETVHILQDVLEALAHAHHSGIVHRDMKPENVMLAQGHALVMDFGIAKAASGAGAGDSLAGTALTSVGISLGTPTYMAPEQAMAQADIDGRADLYAVGVMAYEMLAGAPPFTGPTAQAIVAAHIAGTATPLIQLRPELPEPLTAAIMRCLAKDPADRWPSAASMLGVLEPFATPPSGMTVPAATRAARDRRRMVLAALLLVAGATGLALIWAGPWRRMQATRWAHEQAIPQLLALADRGAWDSAYALARRVEAVNPRDSLFRAMRPKFARRGNLRTAPAGATVRYKPYAAPDSAWTTLGTTPLDSLLMPIGISRLRLEHPGMRTIELLTGSYSVLGGYRDTIPMDPDSAHPHDVVRVTGGELPVFYPQFGHVKPVKLGDYFVHRYEVTNAEFKRFVESGGYTRRELWRYPFVREGRAIAWEDAMRLLRDRTGRSGPATWEAGDFPAGQERYPVGGVSWYEAAAYAEFAGEALPTVVHWNNAASVYHSAAIVPLSNFSGQGPAPVGSHQGISAFGTYDMAGNVREWCLNAEGAARFILGGGWNDQPYQFMDAYAQDPFDRSPTNGIRLVQYPDTSNIAAAAAPLQRASRDFLRERPVSDQVFTAYRQMYAYDRGPMDAAVMERVDEGDWVRELIRLRAGYANDTLLAYLYLPKRGTRPYPAVVYFPGSNAIRDRAPQNLQWRTLDFVIKSGRAVLYPVYKGTYQRSDSLVSDVQDTTNFYRDHVIMWAKDLRRGIDYLETRPEVAVGNLAYYGVSWGGAMGALMPAVEPRISVSVLYVAGLDFERTRPEVDPVNFLPRIRVPTLMLNGKYDFFFPVETSQVPMFRMLGTAPDDKRHVVEEGSHFVPRTRLIQETLEWLDKYQPLPK